MPFLKKEGMISMADTNFIPEFSVIVPVYKTEQYVGRCIASILDQTNADFELILIDDGSPDRSGAICDEYAARDDRIRVIHQKNKGVSAARNAGLDAAQGKYIVFVDSDDTVDINYLECMQDYDADMVIAGVKSYSVDGSQVSRISLLQEECKVLSSALICKMIRNHSFNYTVSKRYLREMIQKENLRFVEYMDLGEDTLFVSHYLCKCNSIQFVSRTPYLYYQYGEKTLSSFSENYVQKLAAANHQIKNALGVRFPDIVDQYEWKKRCWSVFYYSIFYILRNWDVPAIDKRKALHTIFSLPDYKEYKPFLDDYMRDDTKIWRMLLQTGSAGVVMLGWRVLRLISKKKGLSE